MNLINNTIVSNDSTASSGTLFGAFFAPEASVADPVPTRCSGCFHSVRASVRPAARRNFKRPATLRNSWHLSPANILCPVGHGVGGTAPNGRTNGACRTVSFPILYNDVLWQNRAFNIVVTEPDCRIRSSTVDRDVGARVESSHHGRLCAPASGTTYWDIGLRGDHRSEQSRIRLHTFTPQSSVLTEHHRLSGRWYRLQSQHIFLQPGVVHQYCNGSKIPPEAGAGSGTRCPRELSRATCPCLCST